MKKIWLNRIIFILTILGLIVSGYLLYTYVLDTPIVCANSGCETVRDSSFSYFLGIPLPAYGALMYVAIFCLAFARVLFDKYEILFSRAIFGFSFIGVLISAYLTYLEIFIIKAICMWCVASAVIIVMIFLTSAFDNFFIKNEIKR